MSSVSTALHGKVHRLRDAGTDIIATAPNGKIMLVERTNILQDRRNPLKNIANVAIREVCGLFIPLPGSQDGPHGITHKQSNVLRPSCVRIAA